MPSPRPADRERSRSEDRASGRALEQFHLAFIEVATVQLPLDQFALKGGANLRFFFRSLRRSVDLDFDYLGPRERAEAFAGRVDKAFASNALTALLRVRGIALVDLRTPKQTATTRRWKFNLRAAGVDGVPSKIEFSARSEARHAANYELAAVDAGIARQLGARPVKLNHYGAMAAIAQKIAALRLRSETQPRDVFDLDHLLRVEPDALAVVDVAREELHAAKRRALALTYAEYASTVVPYLEEDIVALYETKDAWVDMQLRVADRLEWKEGQR